MHNFFTHMNQLLLSSDLTANCRSASCFSTEDSGSRLIFPKKVSIRWWTIASTGRVPDNTNVSINQVGIIIHFHKKQKGRAQWMPVSHTLGSPYALDTRFLQIRGWFAAKLYVKLRCLFLVDQYMMVCRIFPLGPLVWGARVPTRKSSFLLKKKLPYTSVEYQYNHVFPYLS